MFNVSKISKNYFLVISLFVIFICIFFIPFLSNDLVNQNFNENYNQTSNGNLNFFNGKILSYNNVYWPLPGYSRISSYFGNRSSPTAGATSFHGGIDIPAPAGTNIISVISGIVTRTGFMGSGGYSVVVQNEEYTVTFHHISPNYIVHVGEYVYQGQVIAQVGPKNVYGFTGNPYKDANGNPTNGATTGSHLHLSIKKKNVTIDPLTLF